MVDGGEVVLEVFGPDVDSPRRIRIGPGLIVYCRGEVKPGVVTVSISNDAEPWTVYTGWRSYAVDLNTGSAEPIEGATRPATPWWGGVQTQNPLSNCLFRDDDRSLLLWDPEKDEIEVVINTAE